MPSGSPKLATRFISASAALLKGITQTSGPPTLGISAMKADGWCFSPGSSSCVFMPAGLSVSSSGTPSSSTSSASSAAHRSWRGGGVGSFSPRKSCDQQRMNAISASPSTTPCCARMPMAVPPLAYVVAPIGDL
eukprot:7384173-Prymnesium_polylepis.1